MQKSLLPIIAFVLATGLGTADDDPRGASVVHAIGTLEPTEVVDVASMIAGTVERFGPDPRDPTKPIDYNTPVKEGTVLAQLNPASCQAALGQARADMQRAEAEVRHAQAKVVLAERQLQQIKKRENQPDPIELGIAQAGLDVAKTAVAVAEAAVAQSKASLQRAELNLHSCTIRSPIDGIIIDRRCNIGQAVSSGPNSPALFLIAKDLNRLQVWATVKEKEITKVAKGQKTRFTVDAFPGATFQGQVGQVRLNASADKGQVTYTVVIDVDNANGKLMPYLTADVSIEAGGR
jgi:HlyD family secretion protein